jgi:hypothetical protein
MRMCEYANNIYDMAVLWGFSNMIKRISVSKGIPSPRPFLDIFLIRDIIRGIRFGQIFPVSHTNEIKYILCSTGNLEYEIYPLKDDFHRPNKEIIIMFLK